MIHVGLCCFLLPAASLRAWPAAARQSCVGRPGFSASSPASSRLRFRSGYSCVVCSAPLLEAACFGQEKGVQPGARLRAGHLCFCESHMGQMCVPLLCPFSDLLKADLLQLSKHPGTAAVPALHLIQCQCGDAVWSVLGIQAVSAVLVTRVAAF